MCEGVWIGKVATRRDASLKTFDRLKGYRKKGEGRYEVNYIFSDASFSLSCFAIAERLPP